jgi:tetratricopeptide (TPR) repeat protein
MFQEAVNLMMQKNFVSARHRFEELVKAYPDFELAVDARLFVADCFNYEQKPDDAEVIYKEISKEHPKTPHSWKSNVRLGDMARGNKQHDQAATYYQAAIEDTTDDGHKLTAMNNLSQSYLEAGQIDKGIETMRTMLALAKKPDHRMRVGIQLTNVLASEGRREEAWANMLSLYNPKDSVDVKEAYFSSLLQAAHASKQYQSAFHFFDSIVASATVEEDKAQASYFNGMLAAGTETYRATGTMVLKKTHEFFPKSVYGRRSPLDAARIILSATKVFPDATPEAKALFDTAIKSYDDIINDLTTEWFEPAKSAWAWTQVATAYEMRGYFLESVDDLKSASKTVAQIPQRFKSLPKETERAKQWLAAIANNIRIAEASPTEFWPKVRLRRQGKPLPGEQAAEVKAASETVQAATDTGPIPPEAAKPQ